MCTLAQATAADAALAQMLQDHGGGGQFGAFTVDTPVPIPYTPIALSRQAVVYQYAVAPANTDPKMFFELP